MWGERVESCRVSMSSSLISRKPRFEAVVDQEEMEKALRIYGEVLRLVRRLPKDSRPYYAKYARENFVNYREVEANDPKALDELFHRAYNHSLWVLNKYSVDRSAAEKLKNVCFN